MEGGAGALRGDRAPRPRRGPGVRPPPTGLVRPLPPDLTPKARLAEGAAIRDTKDRDAGYITADQAQWRSFLTAVKAGRFQA
ncbi:DUF397 domain-containing protein [Saccharopolyspora hattusasensis]|uniref:DUF397 domain-containing protein n=1 Tax=Saccharopolyspora hattusasensis TaxID=1128679 RepID=UPI003D954522